MADHLELTLTLHGLDVYGQDVDGEVFARKLTAFLKGIRQSDKAVNGKKRHKLLLTALSKNTATASVREQVYVPGPPAGSGMAHFENAVEAVFNNRPDARRLPLQLVKEIAALNSGVGHSFAFGEVKSNTGMLIRIDDYLGRRARELVVELEADSRAPAARFKGVAFGYFDGVLKLVDLRGDMWRGILILTAGGKQIECTVASLTVEQLRDVLDRRAMIYGKAHYGSGSRLPERLEVTSARRLQDRSAAHLSRWRGAFDLSGAEAAQDWN